eukprot:161839-Rhodomonas_salina.2
MSDFRLGESGSQRRAGAGLHSVQLKRACLAASAALALVAAVAIVSARGEAWRQSSPASTVLAAEEARQLGALYVSARLPLTPNSSMACMAVRRGLREVASRKG